jgi:hypothetical protein
MVFRNILGGRLTLLPPASQFTPTSEKQWVRDAANKVFAEHRKLQAAQYAGMTFGQREALAREAERSQKDARRAWANEQKAIRRRKA